MRFIWNFWDECVIEIRPSFKDIKVKVKLLRKINSKKLNYDEKSKKVFFKVSAKRLNCEICVKIYFISIAFISIIKDREI